MRKFTNRNDVINLSFYHSWSILIEYINLFFKGDLMTQKTCLINVVVADSIFPCFSTFVCVRIIVKSSVKESHNHNICCQVSLLYIRFVIILICVSISTDFFFLNIAELIPKLKLISHHPFSSWSFKKNSLWHCGVGRINFIFQSL